MMKKPKRGNFQLVGSKSTLIENDSASDDDSLSPSNPDAGTIVKKSITLSSVSNLENENVDQSSISSSIDTSNKPESNWKYLLWHLILMTLATSSETMVNAALTVIIPLYTSNVLDKPETYAGILISIQAIGNSLFNPFAGIFISRTSCEMALLVQNIMRIIVLLIMYLCVTINQIKSDYAFIIWCFMCFGYGLTQSLSSVARNSYISLHIPTLNRGRFVTVVVCFRRISFVFGPMVAGVLSHYYSISVPILFCLIWSAFFWIVCVFILIPPKLFYSIDIAPIDDQGNNINGSNYKLAQITSFSDFSILFQNIGLKKRFEMSSWILSESEHHTANNLHASVSNMNDTQSGVSRNPTRRMSTKDVCSAHFKTLFIITMFSFGLKYARKTRKLILTFQAQDLDFPDDKIGYVNTFGYIPDWALFFVAGTMLDKFGRKSTAIPSLIMFIIALSFVSLTKTYSELIIVSILFGFADGISIGLLMTIGADLAPAECRSQFLGFYRMMATSAEVVSPIIVGYLSSQVSIFYACLSAIIVSSFSLIWLIFFVKEPSKNYQQLDNIEPIQTHNHAISDIVESPSTSSNENDVELGDLSQTTQQKDSSDT